MDTPDRFSDHSNWLEHSNWQDLSWIDEEKIPIPVFRFACHVPWIQERLTSIVYNQYFRVLLGVEQKKPQITDQIQEDIWVVESCLSQGTAVDLGLLQSLEERAKFDPVLHIQAAALHVRGNPNREIEARKFLCNPVIPYVFPGDIDPIHIELFAVGDRVLHVLHVDWLRKMGEIAIGVLEEDCRNHGTWLLPFLEVLPERQLKKEILRLSKKSRLQGGGLGVLALYGNSLGMNPIELLQKGNRYDQLLFFVGKEMMRTCAQ